MEALDQTPSGPSTHPDRRRRLPTKVVTLLVATALFGAALLTFHVALAENDGKGVKSLTFGANPDVCLPEQALPCSPDAGTGKSNTLYVRQNLVDGGYRYNELVGTGHGGDVWFQTTLAGECASNHRLRSLWIGAGYLGDFGEDVPEVQVESPPAPFPIDQPVNHDHRTIPTRNVAVHVPTEVVADELLMTAPADLFAWGEDQVADRIGAGTSEHNARLEPSTFDTYAGMHASLVCRKRTNDDKRPRLIDSTWHPVRIVWLGVGMQPGDETTDGWRDGLLPDGPAPEPVAPDLTVGFQVTQAHLSTVSDPADPCLLHLSGAVTTTQPGVVTYRYLDELGRRSQTFSVEVDQTLTAFFADEVHLEPIVLDRPAADGAPAGLVAADDGRIGGLVQEQGDNVQGTFQLEIVEPHAKTSNIASYNVDGCVVADPAPEGIVIEPTPPTPSGPTSPTPPPGVVVDPVPPSDPLAPPSDDLAPTPPAPTPPPSGPSELVLAR